MKTQSIAVGVLLVALALRSDAQPAFAEQNEALFQALRAVHALNEMQLTRVRGIFRRSGFIGQGNPAIARHPMTPEQCKARLLDQGVDYRNAGHERICGARFMAPLFDPATQQATDAPACIDQFEFPDIPCALPVTWVRAVEAADLCEAVGKRLCDAHEWEGACAGRLEAPDYRFDLAKGVSPSVAIDRMRDAHNREEARRKSWSYGSAYQAGICATGSVKSNGCQGGGWNQCGTNTWPAGSFPRCRSALDVYDLHGNAAEHMNLPLDAGQMASRGSRTLGHTEMKGSWFVFDSIYAHEDWCRWRAPYWHGSRVLDTRSHANYHLGFRCCKDVAPGR